MPLNISGPVPRWGTLFLWGLLGAILIVAPRTWLPDWHTTVQIADGFGIAILTSAFLGLTIERWLRADLAKDIFLTAIGHQLPEEYRAELKAELKRLAAFPLLCEQHLLTINIERIDDNCVRVTEMIERTFRNISGSSQSLAAHVHIDEWCFARELSSIQECQVERVGSRSAVERMGKVKRHDNMSISATTKEITLAPGQRAQMTIKSTEIKRPVDDLSFVFTRPTLNPAIEVNVPDGFEYRANFGPDVGEETPEKYSNRKTLQGMYWPLQRMRVHWWTTIAKNQLPEI